MQNSSVYKFFNNYIALIKANNFYRIYKQALSLADILGVDHLNHKVSMVNPLGQLAFKEEAAGKLRVFALVDV